MQLHETIALMTSDKYEDRLIAEYLQTKIRHRQLYQLVVKYEAGTLEHTPACPLEVLKTQSSQMAKYLYCLEVRAQIEKIRLPDCD